MDSLFEALAAPTRRAVLERLREGPASVAEIAAGLPVSRPAVSQHLDVLKRAGLVASRRDGVRNIYSIDRAGVEALRTYCDALWDDVLAAFKRSLEGDSEGGNDAAR